MATPITRLLTYDDIDSIGEDDRIEVIDGEVVPMAPTSWDHSDIAGNIFFEIKLYLREHPVGRAATEGVGLVLNRDPLVLRSPDIAFVQADRIPPSAERGRFLELSPDLAVEVVSSSDRWSEVNKKVAMYLTYGTRLVWVVDPEQRTVMIHDADQPAIVRVVREGEVLEGGNVLPGFEMAVSRIFG